MDFNPLLAAPQTDPSLGGGGVSQMTRGPLIQPMGPLNGQLLGRDTRPHNDGK